MSEKLKGVVIGLVDDLDDPDGLGRIRLRFPWLADDSNQSNWARVAAPLASAELGAFFQPQVDDEALVAFEHGDARRPYIVGYLWNGDNAPPSTDNNVRILQTYTGHKLVFDDTEGSEQIRIEDATGNTITMSADGVTVESKKDLMLKAEGDVTIQGVNVNVEASAQLTAKGNPIHLNP